MRGFSFFLFLENSKQEVVKLLERNNFRTISEDTSISSIPIDDEILALLKHYVCTVKYAGNILFFSHDGFPAYVVEKKIGIA